ncbi:MAG: hypothetical protein M1834_009721 [Cirrosporium novae-zelandiae]|nr:MAG: hypothetical protein M1834_009721 [Cirrosporium novae-zelandiae]
MASTDVEKLTIVDPHTVKVEEDPSLGSEKIVRQDGILGRLRYYEAVFDKKLGIEGHGPDRILPHEKNPPSLWFSGTMNISCFATGFLGWEFGLALKQTIPLVIFSTLIGAAVTGWCATLGPPTGCRQVAICRYSFGWWPSKIIAALNVVEQLGWCTTACVTGGLCLTAVSDGHVSLALGVVIIALVGLVVSFIGLRAVLTFDQYAWIPIFIVFMVIYGEAGRFADTKTPSALAGVSFSAACLNLFSVCYGSSASWSSIVSDYYVHYPVDTHKWKIFILTTLGITIPTCIGMVAGCCVASTMGVDEEWLDTYENDGLGYLIQMILYPRGFAKFLLVLLVLSSIGMTTIAIYSAGLSVQLFARPLKLIPRAFWCLLLCGIILALSIAGREHLQEILENFLSLLGYWNTAFFVIVFLEHYVFRKGNIDNYDLEAWNTQSKLPIGIAGCSAFLIGIVGCILGMVQTWYVGVISKKIGGGGDIGNQLTLVFTIATYLPLRYWELKRFRR